MVHWVGVTEVVEGSGVEGLSGYGRALGGVTGGLGARGWNGESGRECWEGALFPPPPLEGVDS